MLYKFFFLFCYVGQAGLEPVIFLPLPPKCHTSNPLLVVCVLVLYSGPQLGKNSPLLQLAAEIALVHL